MGLEFAAQADDPGGSADDGGLDVGAVLDSGGGLMDVLNTLSDADVDGMSDGALDVILAGLGIEDGIDGGGVAMAGGGYRGALELNGGDDDDLDDAALAGYVEQVSREAAIGPRPDDNDLTAWRSAGEAPSQQWQRERDAAVAAMSPEEIERHWRANGHAPVVAGMPSSNAQYPIAVDRPDNIVPAEVPPEVRAWLNNQWGTSSPYAVDETPAWAGTEPGRPAPGFFGAAKPAAPPLTGQQAWRYSHDDEQAVELAAVPDAPSCRRPWEMADETAAVASHGQAVALANGADGWQPVDDFGAAGGPDEASRATTIAALRRMGQI